MDRLLNPILVPERLTEKHLNLFTLTEFRRVFGISEIAAKKFTERYTKKGLFLRLKKGLFVLKANPPPSFFIANKLYAPSYISFDTALSFHNMIPETIYSITSATPKATREFTCLGIRFTYRTLKKGTYTGYQPVQYLGATVFIAEPEKALADYLYFVDMGKRQLGYERLDLKIVKRAKLLSYVKLFERNSMFALVKKIYVEFRKPQKIY